MSTWIQSYSGKTWDLLNPDPDQITIEDLAWHLAAMPRFCGATREPYSVAEHCVRVSYACEGALGGDASVEDVAFAGLMHDAHEAMVGDATSPMKRAMRAAFATTASAFDLVEAAAELAVREAFGLGIESHPVVKRMDLVLLVTERRDLLNPSEKEWPDHGVHPLCNIIRPWSQDRARQEFLTRFAELGGRRRQQEAQAKRIASKAVAA